MVKTKEGTHGLKWTWCAGVSRNGAGHLVRTYHPPTAKHKLLSCDRPRCTCTLHIAFNTIYSSLTNINNTKHYKLFTLTLHNASHTLFYCK